MLPQLLILLLLKRGVCDGTVNEVPKQLEIYNSSNITNATAGMPEFGRLEDICRHLHIPPNECKCERLNITCEDSEYLTKADHRKESHIFATFCIICSVVGIIGNLAVVYVCFYERIDTSHFKVLIGELALVDLIFSIMNIISVIFLFWTNKWIYGLAMCKILKSCEVFGNILSIGFILTIAVERFLGVLFPMQKQFNRGKLSHILVGINIFIAMGTTLPFFLFLEIDSEFGRCLPHWPIGSNYGIVYYWILMVIYGIIPAIIIFVIYIMVIRKLSQGVKRVEMMSNKEYLQKRLTENRRIMNISMFLLLVFIVSVFPSRVISIYMETDTVKADNYRTLTEELYVALVYIHGLTYPLHPAVNPIVYSAVDPNWRKAMFHILTCGVTRIFPITKRHGTMYIPNQVVVLGTAC